MKVWVMVWILLCSYLGMMTIILCYNIPWLSLDIYLDGCKTSGSDKTSGKQETNKLPTILTKARTVRVKKGDNFNLLCEVDDLGKENIRVNKVIVLFQEHLISSGQRRTRILLLTPELVLRLWRMEAV